MHLALSGLVVVGVSVGFAQFPIDELAGIGADLSRIEAELSAPRKSLADAQGLGSQQQDAIRNAIEDFHTDWATSVAQVVDN
ncbi:hypothetical protein, partial [Nocardia sp. NPDC058497]|uniref:hypothetical protein n=1 Tax=Nocardia sp. NPDC058497 TaxID=3346529 RepID=UPI00364D1F60